MTLIFNKVTSVTAVSESPTSTSAIAGRRLGLLQRLTAGNRCVVEKWLLELSLADLRNRTGDELRGH